MHSSVSVVLVVEGGAMQVCDAWALYFLLPMIRVRVFLRLVPGQHHCW